MFHLQHRTILIQISNYVINSYEFISKEHRLIFSYFFWTFGHMSWIGFPSSYFGMQVSAQQWEMKVEIVNLPSKKSRFSRVFPYKTSDIFLQI